MRNASDAPRLLRQPCRDQDEFGLAVQPYAGYPLSMPVVATIMNSTTGQPIQRMTFGRMPKPWASFTLESGELVKADRVDVGKPAPGKVVVPVSVWVTPKG